MLSKRIEMTFSLPIPATQYRVYNIAKPPWPLYGESVLLAAIPGEHRRQKRPLTPDRFDRALLAVFPPEDRIIVRRERVLDEIGLDQVLEALLPVQTSESGTGDFDPVRASGIDELLDVLGGGKVVVMEGIALGLEIDHSVFVGRALDRGAETVSQILVARLAMVGV